MILDADILIDILRGLPAADQWVTSQSAMVVVSGIAAIELVYGARDAMGLRQARELLSTFVIEWPTSDDVQRAVSMAPLHLSCGIDGPDARLQLESAHLLLHSTSNTSAPSRA